MGARRLVALGQVQSADLVEAPGAGWVEDVAELVVPRGPAVGLAETGQEVVHAVRSRKGKTAVARPDEAPAVVGGDRLVVHGHPAASDGVLLGALAGDKEVVGVVGDVVGSARLVDA